MEGPDPVHTTLSLLNHALAATPTPSSSSSGKGGGFGVFLLPILIIAVVYFAFMRPARKRQQAAAAVKREVSVGDEVTTTAGLIATVVAVQDDFLTLEVAPGVHCRYVPAAILRVNRDEEPEDFDQAGDEDEVTADGGGEALDASTHEVIDQPTPTVDEPTITATPSASDPPRVTEPPVIDVPPTVVDEPSVTPVDSTDGTTETPGGTKPT
jgi:preprotein translocase subunit YajC